MVRRFIYLMTGGALLATAGAFFARFYWAFELLTHFKAQLAAGALVLAIVALGIRVYRAAALCALVFAVNAAYLVPYVMPQPKAAVAESDSWRILSANVSFRNRQYEALRRLIEETRPDVIGLVEVDSEWAEQLSPLYGEYPYRIVRPHDRAFGFALLSRTPVTEAAGSPYRRGDMNAALLVELELGEHSIDLTLAHVMAPTSPSASALRNQQLADLSDIIRGNGLRHQVLIGDLNITPWSPYYRLVEADAGLVAGGRGDGYLGTWPTSPSILRIPIDHCLLSGGLETDSIRLGPDIGSDHLPLIIDFSPANDPQQVHSSSR